MNLAIPDLSLVMLIGPSGSGKSSFGRAHFRPTEVLSSDVCRGLVSDDENNLAATGDAFELLHYIAGKRLAAGRLTVVDATNVQRDARQPLIELARRYHVLPIAIVLNLSEALCHARNATRPDRAFGPHVVRRQRQQLRQGLRHLQREGFHAVHIFDTPDEVAAVTIERQPLWTDRRTEHGPFDIIGDVHGCFDETLALLDRLGYAAIETTDPDGVRGWEVTPPHGRRAIFLGDLCDRGPDSVGVLRLVMGMVADGTAFCLPGNHDVKLMRALKGRNVQRTHGLAETMEQVAAEPEAFRTRVATFLDALIGHAVLDEGRLVVAHAGMKAEMQGRASRAARDFALYGETTGETDEFGLPVRLNWANDYRGQAMVVYGHTPVAEAEWLNNTINIDTGCVFGGSLTAVRYPERELVSVPAGRTYYEPVRPFLPDDEAASGLSPQQQHDDLLDLADFTGKRIVSTRLHRTITINAENAAAALEVMSRFAVNPKWLIYLPPTMSPSETTTQPGLLEHPAEAFSYYRQTGLPRVVCEEKHMGSRAVVVLCRGEAVARRRFGVTGEGVGVCITRTGRRFFDDAALEAALLDRLNQALEQAGLWERLQTDWVCLDAELMPWSVKAQELLQRQYAAVGAAARTGLGLAVAALTEAAASTSEATALRDAYQERATMAEQFVAAYRRYCWPVASLADLKLAPFHLLAGEGQVHIDRDHGWHMATLADLCQADAEAHPTAPVLLATAWRGVDLLDPADEAAAIAWWLDLTHHGGEGMVVKPFDFIATTARGLVQPAVKCRGPEYLRIIYGPEYTAPANLDRLRSRGLGAKRGLAVREFALGIEGLERFVRREPLYRVHECVFGVLALESEPVDPRL